MTFPIKSAFLLILGHLLTGSMAFAHDLGVGHLDIASDSALPPPEIFNVVSRHQQPPAANSAIARALTDRYLGERRNSPPRATGGSAPAWFSGAKSQTPAARPVATRASVLSKSVLTNPLATTLSTGLTSFVAPSGNALLMAASFAPFKPRVRYYWDGTTFYEESDNMPDNSMMPNLMVGITSWQQQIPVPASYFASTTNPENNTGSLGYGQPNYWRLPLIPTPSGSPIAISSGNFQRGAVALAANGIAIFNPKNNTGRVSYEIGELDAYGGHCGLADDYHYHIIPTHLLSAFGGILSNDKPVAWSLDGYPIYGYLEPDGSARQTLDADGGHDIGNGWGYHYHAIGTTATDASHPYGTPQSPYLMNAFHGTVVNFGGQVDGQPEVGSIRASGTGGYTAQPVSGASIVAFKNPVALTTDGSGHLVENVGGTASPDSYLMRVSISGTNYDECWRINRNVTPKTMTVTWRLAGATTTSTYSPTTGTAAGNRLAPYTMGAWSQTKLPDTSQTQDTTATFGEDADYSINAQSFADNGNGTISDNVTGLMWQKTDNGESTWETAVANATGVTTGGYSDWRLPTPAELFSIFNHQNQNPALNTTYFPSNGAGAADYWWTSDVYGSSSTNVWCSNAGGGLGGKPKSETISAGGVLRYHARYVRGAKPSNLHAYVNNLDGTITDTDTGLMWTQLPATAVTWDAALTYAEGLSLGGFTDWRLPNVKELQTLTDYSLATATTTTGIKPSMNRTMFARTLTNCATTSGSPSVTCADTTGLLVGMPIVDQSDVAGTYLSNTTAPTVTSITNSTTFVLSAAATGTGSGLTLKGLAPPTAFWSSTSLKGDVTKAWLVEFGINSSVLAANGPTRNSQGIISYEAKTSSYPVFTVRTTSIVTQIAVEQPANTALTDGVSTVSYGNVNVGSTSTKTFTIRNNGATSLTITGVTIDGTSAANFSVITAAASSVAAGGSTTMDVQFNASSAGTKIAALHIASSDTAVGTAFDVTLSGTGYIPPPTITGLTAIPTVPSNVDTPYVTATVTPAIGATISSVQLNFSTGAQITGPAFREIFANGSTTSGITGAMNAWTTTAVRAASDVRERGGASNHTSAIVLTSGATTSGSTTVTCASTASLIRGMSISGPNVATGTTISSITNGTTLELSTSATGTGSNLSLTAAGVTLTGCTTTSASASVLCGSTTDLVAGMGVSGVATSPPNPTISSITDATHFVLSGTVTTGASNVTLTATGCALEFNNGTSNYTDTTATTSAIDAGAASSGSVEFYVRTADLVANNGWTFQISPDGGTNWNTRLSENYAGSTVNLASCALNGTNSVTCASTAGLVAGMVVQGTPAALTGCGTTNASPTVTCANTTGLGAGMYVNGTGIPNGTRILSFIANTSFTMSANATATGTVSVNANYLNANTTVSSITNATTFVLSSAPVYVGSGLSLFATTVNHGYALMHYDLVSGDTTANMKVRFQFSGYNGTAPNRPPTCDIDDIVLSLTSGSPPATVTMLDDGAHGDGSAGDGIYGVQLPAQTSGTTVTYTITATDSNASTSTASGSYTTGPAPSITTGAALSNAAPNAAYSTTLVASGGTGTIYTWNLLSGTLPAGLSLSTAGVISGTPTAQGTFNFAIKVTDSAGRISTKAFTLTVTTTTAPNVVIILTDDQGWGDIGYHTYGSNVPVQTPNMDRLGVDGIRLEKFYPTTVCAVTRGCLLTGRNSLRTNVGNQRGLGLAEHLMPQTFKAAGYQTFMCGKWHIGGWDNDIYTATVNGQTITVNHEGDEYLPLQRGWDFHKGQYGGAIGYWSHTTVDPGKNSALDWWLNGAPLTELTDAEGDYLVTNGQPAGGYSTDLLADTAVAQIQGRDKAKPMLLYLAFNGVHAGVQAPQSYLTKYQNLGVTDASRRTLMAAVDCMDVAIGRVLAALDTAGIANNTLVLFMSDNGGDTSTGSINLPLRGTKSDSYDGGLHTPAAIRWPGHLPAGVTSDQYVWVGDIFPTLCAAVGVTPQNTKPFDGMNLWPQLQSISSANPNGSARGTTLVTGAAAGPVALDSFTDPINGGSKVFKLIRHKSGSTVTNELFNMSDDPYEGSDLLLGANASTYSSIVTSLTAAITGIVVESYPPYIGPPGITQSIPQGNSITLYAPFSSYKTPAAQWRKNGVVLSGATSFTQVTDSGSPVNGVYLATLTLTNVNGTDAGNYDVVVTNAVGNVSSQAGTVTVTRPVSTQTDGLPDSWKIAHGINPNSTATINGPLGDIDHDGRTNLLEYALNSDPSAMEPDPLHSAVATKLADGQSYLEFSYPRRIGSVDLAYTVEISDDLTTWPSPTAATEPVSIVPNADGVTETVTVRILPAINSTAHKFVRLKVTTQ